VQNQSLLKSIDTLLVSQGFFVLNDVQIAVLEGTLAGDSYPILADRSTPVQNLQNCGNTRNIRKHDQLPVDAEQPEYTL
jgi:hypothetical protein